MGNFIFCAVQVLITDTVSDVFLILVSDAQPGIFQGREVFLESGHFDKHFMYNTGKKGPAGKNLELFSPGNS